MIEFRYEYLTELIMNGIIQRQHLLKNFTEKFKLTESQFDKDLKIARGRIREVLQIDKDQNKAEIMARYNVLYTKNLKIQDYRECRTLLDSLSKIGGFFIDNKKHEITSVQPIKIESATPEEEKANEETMDDLKE